MTETTQPKAGIFVTGTNTDIGKTLTCAALMALLDAQYWKPVQSGPVEDHDAPIASLNRFLPMKQRVLPEPISISLTLSGPMRPQNLQLSKVPAAYSFL